LFESFIKLLICHSYLQIVYFWIVKTSAMALFLSHQFYKVFQMHMLASRSCGEPHFLVIVVFSWLW